MACVVPQFQFDPDEPPRRGASARRTLMIRNIPNKYTQAMLLEMLDSHSRCDARSRSHHAAGLLFVGCTPALDAGTKAVFL